MFHFLKAFIDRAHAYYWQNLFSLIPILKRLKDKAIKQMGTSGSKNTPRAQQNIVALIRFFKYPDMPVRHYPSESAFIKKFKIISYRIRMRNCYCLKAVNELIGSYLSAACDIRIRHSVGALNKTIRLRGAARNANCRLFLKMTPGDKSTIASIGQR